MAAEMISDRSVNAQDFTVYATKGVVKLSGTVESREEPDRTAEIAQALEVVVHLDSHSMKAGRVELSAWLV
jgi:osmotically-inducible protein OsmY